MKGNHAFYAKNLTKEEKDLIDIVKTLFGLDNKELLLKSVKSLIREHNMENEVNKLLEVRKNIDRRGTLCQE